MTLLLGLDIGTTSLKAIRYDTDLGQVTRIATRPTPVDHPQTGWSEHSPQELWAAVVECIREAAGGERIVGLAISSMAEAGVLLDARGEPVAPIIAWYDRRSEPQASWIEEKRSVADIYAITGQRVSPSFGVTKLLWLREAEPQAYARGALWLPVPSYLLWKLTGQAAVDYTIAARTLLFDQRSLSWSAELMNLFELPASFFPQAFPGSTPVGSLTAEAAEETGLPRETVCALGGHDHLCAALAAGAHAPGAVIDSTGSANALLLLLPRFLPNPELAERGYASYAYVIKERYALKGGLKAAGSAIEWLARQFSGAAERSEEGEQPDYASLEAAAAEGVARRAGPLWLPHLIGSGTPEGDRFSLAAAVGIQYEHTRGDIFRGLLEALALWTRHNLEEMQALTHLEMASFAIIGGVTRLGLLSQLKADALHRPVLIPQIPEAAATGAALLAGVGSGAFAGPAEALASLRYDCNQVDPLPEHEAWYDAIYEQVYRPLYAALKPVNEAIYHLNSRANPPGIR